jgi:hypothetical protein
MMTGRKRKGPGAAATAHRAGFVACGKPTRLNSAKLDCHQPAIHRLHRARIHAEGPAGSFTATGQVAKALAALVAAGARGVTALEVNSWAYRLGAYVHLLRHDCGLAIETVREPHEGGWHGRYVLRCRVTLEPVQ